MEQSEAFKKGVATIKTLERQLENCRNAGRVCEQSALEAAKEIEEHFVMCMNILAARRETLLKDIAQKVSNQKKRAKDTYTKLAVSIRAYKQTMAAAIALYAINANAAEVIFKELENLHIPKDFDTRVKVDLPTSLFATVQAHGKVHDFGRFSFVETVSTIAGSVQGNKDGAGLNARFSYPSGICLNPHDSCLYICDSVNSTIRKLTMQGEVSTFVIFNHKTRLCGITFNNKKNVFFATTFDSRTIVKVTSLGAMSVFAGSGQKGIADGVGTSASFESPCGITVDQQTGNLFVSDANIIRKITSKGVVSTLAGSEEGFVDGNGQAAKFSNPWRMCYDEHSQSLLVCDFGNNKLRRVKLNGDVSTVCEINQPNSVVIAANQSILVTSFSNLLFKVVQTGQNYTAIVLAGSGRAERVDGRGEECSFFTPCGIAVHDPTESCFVAERDSHSIRRIEFAKN